MSTTLTYNSVTLQNVLTKKFEQEAIYDDSGTDLLYHKFTVRAVGYIHKHPITPAAPDVVAVEPRATLIPTADYAYIRAALLEPRQRLSLMVGNDSLLTVLPMGAVPDTSVRIRQTDVNNGPKPKFCEVTRIAGTSILQVEFEVEAFILECNQDANLSNVLNNRFSVSDSIDEDWYTTRTYRGRIRFKSLAPNAHGYRHWVIPPLQRGFKRQQVELASSVDGLALDYVVTDKEVYSSCPYPGTSWEATHTVTTGEHSLNAISEMVVSVKGPRTVPKDDLIATCALITMMRLDLSVQRQKEYMLLGASIVDYVHDNRVEMRARIQENIQDSKGNINQLAVAIGRLGKPLKFFGAYAFGGNANYDPELSPVTPYFGTATWTGLFVCDLQSPCDSNHIVPQLVDAPPEKEKEDPGESGQANIFEYPPGTILAGITDPVLGDNVSLEHRESLYSYYRIDVEYQSTAMRVALPIAGPLTSQNDPTCAVVRLARAQARATVRVEAERIGDWPTMPLTIDFIDVNGIPWFFDRDRVISKTPTLGPNGRTRIFSIDQEFHYILARPLLVGERLSTGKLPFDTFTVQQNMLPASKFSLKWA